MKKINKRGISTALIGVILVGLFLVIMLGFLFFSEKALTKEEKIAQVQKWVLISSLKKETPFTEKKYPPIIGINDPVQITTDNDFKSIKGQPPKVYKEIGDGLVDCWRSFLLGEEDFLKSGEKFCYPCQKIEFSESVKTNHPQLSGLNQFLRDHKFAPGNNQPTYAQYLYRSNPKLLELQVNQGTDVLLTKDDLYIYFISMKKDDWASAIRAVGAGTAGGVAAGAVIGTFVFPGIGTGVGALLGGVGGGISLEQLEERYSLFSDEKWNPKVIIADPKTIEEACKE